VGIFLFKSTYRLKFIIALLLLIGWVSDVHAYSVLTHEEIVDMLWKDQIVPLLQHRYHGITDDQLKEAHAYAYGGAVIQDLGYYPFGSHEFSDLVHYVRSGDFVRQLLIDSQDPNEYAFALGALAHYASDTEGHPAVNASVAIEYPKLKSRFGPRVTYAEDKSAHLKTEFSFDVVQVAKQRYVSQHYHDFIGFEVSKSLLERSFPKVYGIPLKDVLTHEDLAIGTYRYAISGLIPHMTQVAVLVRGDDMVKERPDTAKKQFLYHLNRASYEKDWGKDYRRPGAGTRFLAALLRVMPKIGPFKALAFKNPTTKTEDLYFKSITASVNRYQRYLVEDGYLEKPVSLPNLNFDTGNKTTPGEYVLTDNTYATLLEQLTKNNFTTLTPELRDNILEFYSNPNAPIATKKKKAKWQATLKNLDQLKNAQMPATQTASQ
jgi:hypothetical protein